MEVALGAPVLTMVPRVEGWRNRDEAKLITIVDSLSRAAEAYRVLRPVLLAAATQKRGVKTVMVLSPMAGEGKSTTAANLAVVLAHRAGAWRSSRPTSVVRDRTSSSRSRPSRGSPSSWAGPRRSRRSSGGSARRWVATSSSTPPAASGRTPPTPPVASDAAFPRGPARGVRLPDLGLPARARGLDALPLIPLSDGVLFVADAESTTREQVSLARDRLLQMGANLLGAVINGLSGSSSGYYDDRYAYTYQPTTATNGNGSARSAPAASRSGAGDRGMTTRLSAAWAEREPRSPWTLIVIAAAAGSVVGGSRWARSRSSAERGDAPVRRGGRRGVRVAGVR